MKCKKCGAEVSAQDKICKNCGEAVNSKQDEMEVDLNLDDQPYEVKKEDIDSQDTQEEEMETSELLDALMEDKRKILGMAGALLFIVGSYFNLWGLYHKDLGIMSQGNLFGGFMAGGIFGKISVFAAFAILVLICVNRCVYAWYVAVLSAASFLVQVLIILIAGRNNLGTGISGIVIPGVGFFLCIAGLVMSFVFIRQLHQSERAHGSKRSVRPHQ